MFGLGFQEILIILLIFVVLFGAKRLPEIGRGLGKTVKEIRNIRDERKADKEKKKEDQKGSLVSDIKDMKKKTHLFTLKKKPKTI